jgi:hypothetical protein
MSEIGAVPVVGTPRERDCATVYVPGAQAWLAMLNVRGVLVEAVSAKSEHGARRACVRKVYRWLKSGRIK